jgi:hypothetical protein
MLGELKPKGPKGSSGAHGHCPAELLNTEGAGGGARMEMRL